MNASLLPHTCHCIYTVFTSTIYHSLFSDFVYPYHSSFFLSLINYDLLTPCSYLAFEWSETDTELSPLIGVAWDVWDAGWKEQVQCKYKHPCLFMCVCMYVCTCVCLYVCVVCVCYSVYICVLCVGLETEKKKIKKILLSLQQILPSRGFTTLKTQKPLNFLEIWWIS